MKVLIDTECWLWSLLAPERLARKAHDLISELRNPILLSAASSWEIAIKVALGKLKLPSPAERYVPTRMNDQGIAGLPIAHAHALRAGALPPHHGDPFDRLLVAQAQLEKCTLLTADAQLLAYDVETIWAGRNPPPSRRRRLK